MGYDLYPDTEGETIQGLMNEIIPLLLVKNTEQGPPLIATELGKALSQFVIGCPMAEDDSVMSKVYNENCRSIAREFSSQISRLFDMLFNYRSDYVGLTGSPEPIRTVQAAHFHITQSAFDQYWDRCHNAHNAKVITGEANHDFEIEKIPAGNIKEYGEKLDKFKRRREALAAKKLHIQEQEINMRKAIREAERNLEVYKNEWKDFIKSLRKEYNAEKSIRAEDWPG